MLDDAGQQCPEALLAVVRVAVGGVQRDVVAEVAVTGARVSGGEGYQQGSLARCGENRCVIGRRCGVERLKIEAVARQLFSQPEVLRPNISLGKHAGIHRQIRAAQPADDGVDHDFRWRRG